MSAKAVSNARLSKVLGALLGVHAGDSLGATLEFMSFNEVKSRYPKGLRDIIGGGPFNWTAGYATDDTDLTRAVLLAYRDREESKKNAQPGKPFSILDSAAEWALKWFEGEWPERSKGESPVDIGGATHTGLSQYARSRNPKNCGAGHGSAGNGSLMRCIPTALFTNSKEERIKESMEISAITHTDPRCTVSCAVYNEIVAALVDGKTPQEAVAVGAALVKEMDCPAVEWAVDRGKGLSIIEIAEKGPGDELPQRTSGYVLQSLSVAIAALLDPRSFEDVLVDVVRIGGDTDTNGAISGGLLGARNGINGIPERWLEMLQFREEFEATAKYLLQTEKLL